MSAIVLLTTEEAAEQLRVSTRTVKRLVKAGNLRSVKIGRRTLITEYELAAYVAHIEGRRPDRTRMAS